MLLLGKRYGVQRWLADGSLEEFVLLMKTLHNMFST